VDALTAARAQMGMSLGFHMVFAAFGIGLPLLMLVAEALWLRTGRPHYRDLARKSGKATGLLFAIGAVSLSFDLGLLWPRFMEFAGSIVGPAFALEESANRHRDASQPVGEFGPSRTGTGPGRSPR